MPKDLSDAALVRKVRGDMSQVAFAKELGVAQSMLSDWERGAVKPRSETWMVIGNFAGAPFNVDCWERGGMPKQIVNFLRSELGRHAYEKSFEYEEMRKYLARHEISPEPVTEPLGDEPVGGEPRALKGLSKTVEEFAARHSVRPPVKLEQADLDGVKARAREVDQEWRRYCGLPPAEPVIGEAKPPTPAKKAKRQRRQRK